MVFHILFFTISISKRDYTSKQCKVVQENHFFEQNFQNIRDQYLQNFNR